MHGQPRIHGYPFAASTVISLDHIAPSLTDAFILELCLLLRLIQTLMPSVSHNVPVCVATEQVKFLSLRRLANRQTRHGTHEKSSYELLRPPRESMPFINRRIANNSVTANSLWRWA